MAGRKQHYIPQSLLRGFEASRSGKKVQVVVYKQGAAPFVTSTEGIAAQRDFYSMPSVDDTDTLDDLVTNFETERFNPILSALRSVRNGEVEPEQAATAVVHLTFRTAHLRGSFARFAQELVAHFGFVLQDSEAVRDFTGIDSALPDSLLAQKITQELDALPFAALPTKDKVLLEKLARFRVREKFDELILEAAPLLRQHLLGMEQTFPAAIERGHVEALKRSLVPESRVATLTKLRWQVVSLQESQHFVLPDCLAVAGMDRSFEDLQPYTLSSDMEVALVAMPISSTQVLIGSHDDVQADPSLLNLEFAKCSLEFFVSSSKDHYADGLAKEIGTKIAAMTESQIKDKISLPESGIELGSQKPRECLDKSLLARIRLPPNTTREVEIKAAISDLFAEQCGVCEALRLDSIVVALDVQSAVSELRGRRLTPKESQEVALGTVEFVGSGDTARICLMLPSEIAALLLLPKHKPEHQAATYLVKHNLGRLTYLDHWIRCVSRASTLSKVGPQENLSIEFVSRFGSHYFGARIAASGATYLENLDNSIDVFAQVISGTLSALEAARKQFWSDRNIDKLALEAFAVIDQLLVTAASACGLHASKKTAMPANSSAGNLLMRSGLWDWFRLFDRDLGRHFQTRGQWPSIEEALKLVDHANRILWQFGIFVSESPEGQLWIDVYDDEKLQAINQALRN